MTTYSDNPTTEVRDEVNNPTSTPILSEAATPKHKPFQDVIQKISPLADDTKTKLFNRKRRGEKSEILTSTPYKKKLEERLNPAQEKKRKAEKNKLRKYNKKEENVHSNQEHKETASKKRTVEEQEGQKEGSARAVGKEIQARKKLKFDGNHTDVSENKTECHLFRNK